MSCPSCFKIPFVNCCHVWLSLLLLIYQLGADCHRRWIMLRVDGMVGNPSTSLFLMRRWGNSYQWRLGFLPTKNCRILMFCNNSHQNGVVFHNCNKNATLNKNAGFTETETERESQRERAEERERDPAREPEREPERAKERDSHRDSLWLSLCFSLALSNSLSGCLSLRIRLQSPCLAHKALARLGASLLRSSTLSWSGQGGPRFGRTFEDERGVMDEDGFFVSWFLLLYLYPFCFLMLPWF